MPFRKELLVKKGEQYYLQTFEFVSSLPNPNEWGEDKYLVVVELSLYRDKFLPNPVFYSKAAVPSIWIVQKLLLFLGCG